VARLTSLPEAQRAVLADPLVSSWRTPLMVAAARAGQLLTALAAQHPTPLRV